MSDEDSEECDVGTERDVGTEPKEGEDFIITVNGDFDNEEENSVDEMEDAEEAD